MEYYFYMQLSKLLKKNHNPLNPDQSLKVIKSLSWSLHKKMVKQYSTSQGYFYTKIIQDIIEKKQSDKNCIRTNDVKFDDCKQHMQKFYQSQQSCHEFPQLLQYYKYYSQDSICFLNKEFAFLSVYHEKKKAVLYQQLKKQLNISDSQDTIGEVTRVKSPQKYDNVLSGLEMTRTNDESYLVAEILKKLVSHYGPSRVKTLNKIDCQFKFMTHNLAIGKSKNSTKDGPNSINPQTMLQSTNTSVRNNCYLKAQQKSSNSKNPTHRRFGSCQVPKSAMARTTNLYTKQNKQNKKNNRIRRRKSAELISYIDSNTAISTLQSYKKESVKTEQHTKPTNKMQLTQNNFRSNMEELRKKIRKQKDSICKKQLQQSTNCFSKKKFKKS